MSVFGDFQSLESEFETIREFNRRQLWYFIERLETCATDLVDYYKKEDTPNFDRGLVIDMLKKIDHFVSQTEALMEKLKEEKKKDKERRKEEREREKM